MPPESNEPTGSAPKLPTTKRSRSSTTITRESSDDDRCGLLQQAPKPLHLENLEPRSFSPSILEPFNLANIIKDLRVRSLSNFNYLHTTHPFHFPHKQAAGTPTPKTKSQKTKNPVRRNRSSSIEVSENS